MWKYWKSVPVDYKADYRKDLKVRMEGKRSSFRKGNTSEAEIVKMEIVKEKKTTRKENLNPSGKKSLKNE